MRHLWHLNPRFSTHAKMLDRKRKLGMNQSNRNRRDWVGVHVRKGDCADCKYKWQQYLNSALVFKELYGTSKIFLATDDQGMADACKSNATIEKGFECHDAPRTLDRSLYAESRPNGDYTHRERSWIENRLKNNATMQNADLATGCIVDW